MGVMQALPQKEGVATLWVLSSGAIVACDATFTGERERLHTYLPQTLSLTVLGMISLQHDGVVDIHSPVNGIVGTAYIHVPQVPYHHPHCATYCMQTGWATSRETCS
jgi:hypothetical protein